MTLMSRDSLALSRGRKLISAVMMAHQTTKRDVAIISVGLLPNFSIKNAPYVDTMSWSILRMALYRSWVCGFSTPTWKRRTGIKYVTAPLPDHCMRISNRNGQCGCVSHLAENCNARHAHQPPCCSSGIEHLRVVPPPLVWTFYKNSINHLPQRESHNRTPSISSPNIFCENSDCFLLAVVWK